MSNEKVSDLEYLNQTMSGNKKLIKEIIDVFLKQAPEELSVIKKAIDSQNYAVIKKVAHTMKSTASIMGISSALPILKQMEELASSEQPLDKIRELNTEMTKMLEQAVEEVKSARQEYL